MEIILSLAILYIRNILSKPKTFIIYILLIIASGYNGFIIASSINSYDSKIITLIVSVSLFFFTLIRKFFPSLESFAKPIKPHYPINSIKRYFINLINDSLLQIHFILIVFFLFFFFLYSLYITPNEKMFITAFLGAALILRRSLISTVFQEKSLRNDIPISVIWIINILLCFIFAFYYESIGLTFCIAIICIFLISGFLLEEKYTKFTDSPVTSHNVFKNPLLELLFGNPKFKLWFFTAVVVKVIFLLTLTILFIQKNKYPPFFFIVLFTSPIIPFNYALNNTFGFFDKYWFSLEKSSPTGKNVFSHFLKLIKLPILIDTIITIIFVVINKSLIIPVLIIYIGSLPILIPLAFYWSVLFPKSIQTTLFNTKPTTALLPAIATFLFCISFIPISVSNWFGLLGFLYFLSALILINNLNGFYNRKKHLLFIELFKK